MSVLPTPMKFVLHSTHLYIFIEALLSMNSWYALIFNSSIEFQFGNSEYAGELPNLLYTFLKLTAAYKIQHEQRFHYNSPVISCHYT